MHMKINHAYRITKIVFLSSECVSFKKGNTSSSSSFLFTSKKIQWDGDLGHIDMLFKVTIDTKYTIYIINSLYI